MNKVGLGEMGKGLSIRCLDAKLKRLVSFLDNNGLIKWWATQRS